eukprot:4934832-Pleurochrysis_carterae.AAC.3
MPHLRVQYQAYNEYMLYYTHFFFGVPEISSVIQLHYEGVVLMCGSCTVATHANAQTIGWVSFNETKQRC